MNSTVLLRVNRKKRVQRVRNIVIVALVVISTLSVLIFSSNYKDTKCDIGKDIIKKYIEYTEKECGEKYIVDWREVATVYSLTRNSNFDKITEEDFTEIIGNFYTYKNKEIAGIKNLKEVLDLYDLKEKEIELGFSILKSLEKKSLYENLYIEKDKVDFIVDIKEQAFKNYNEYKILPSITIAQGILESGWGKSELSVKSNNLFGIKADSRWKGKTYEINSKENYDEEYVSAFRSYNNTTQSIEDHGKFLNENTRYKESGLFSGKNYIEQAESLEKAGYSTAKDSDGNLIYADKLIRVIRDYNLMSYDVVAIRKQFNN